jgi:hypothetical protein
MLNVAHILIYSSATRGGPSSFNPRHDRHIVLPCIEDVNDVDSEAFLHLSACRSTTFHLVSSVEKCVMMAHHAYEQSASLRWTDSTQ